MVTLKQTAWRTEQTVRSGAAAMQTMGMTHAIAEEEAGARAGLQRLEKQVGLRVLPEAMAEEEVEALEAQVLPMEPREQPLSAGMAVLAEAAVAGARAEAETRATRVLPQLAEEEVEATRVFQAAMVPAVLNGPRTELAEAGGGLATTREV